MSSRWDRAPESGPDGVPIPEPHTWGTGGGDSWSGGPSYGRDWSTGPTRLHQVPQQGAPGGPAPILQTPSDGSGNAGATIDPTTGQSTTPTATAATAGPLDLNSLLTGNILGIPTWLVIGVGVYFLFFHGKR